MPGRKTAAWVRNALLTFLFLQFTLPVLASRSIVLGWDRSADPTVAGYSVYCGTNSGQYTLRVDASNQTAAKLTNLQEGITYYFAITAYDTNGVESALSPEVSFIVPGFLQLSQASMSSGAMLILFPVAPPHWYEIQASSDLQTWMTLGQTDVVTANEWTSFADFQSSTLPRRFYRLVEH